MSLPFDPISLIRKQLRKTGRAPRSTITLIAPEKPVDKAQNIPEPATAPEKLVDKALKSPEPAKPPKGMKALLMQDIGMSEMDINGAFYVERIYPFNTTPVFYMESGATKYDAFFKDAACVAGTVLLAQRIVSAIQDKDQEVFVKLSMNPTPPFIEAGSPLFNFATNSLPGCLAKAKELLATGKELSGSMKNDFKGLNVRKIPDITRGISESVTNLNTAITEIPKLMEQLEMK